MSLQPVKPMAERTITVVKKSVFFIDLVFSVLYGRRNSYLNKARILLMLDAVDLAVLIAFTVFCSAACNFWVSTLLTKLFRLFVIILDV